MGRSPCCDKATVKRGPWSADEDARLRSHIEQHGTGGSWIELPGKAGLRRCGKSCRLRWLNYLRPDLRHGGFSPEEDRVICALYAAVGSRWSLIAAHLPGRTDNGVKNYWNTRLKKMLLGIKKPPQPHGRRQYRQAANVHLCRLGAANLTNYDTAGCNGGVDQMHVGVVGGGTDVDRQHETRRRLSISQHADTCYTIDEPAATSELDEIFRSIGTSGGEHSDLSQSSTDMEALNLYHHGGMSYPYW